MKTIAIIGATGSMGSTIAKSLSKDGKYRLLLMARDQDKLVHLKLELEKSGTEAFAMSCAKEASWEADTIIIATPVEAEREIADKIREVAVGKTVVSLSKPPAKLTTDQAASANGRAEDIQKLLPNSKVVSAFDSSSAVGFATAIDVNANAFIAGTDRETLEAVSDIVRNGGFNPVIARKFTAGRANGTHVPASDSTYQHLQLNGRIEDSIQINIDGMANTDYTIEKTKAFIALVVLAVVVGFVLSQFVA